MIAITQTSAVTRLAELMPQSSVGYNSKGIVKVALLPLLCIDAKPELWEESMSDISKIEWTREEVIKAVSILAEKRHGVDFETYVQMVKTENENIDRCKDSDIIGLLALIGLGLDTLAAA
jgi:hypothetical protein